jgi:hypothetical protein
MPCPCNKTGNRPGDFYSDERMANQPPVLPGDCAPLDTGALLIGGVILGGLGALFLANLTGSTSLFGIGGKVKHGIGHTGRSVKRTFK